MFTKIGDKHYTVFIIAWLVIFIFCSILSGVATAAEPVDTGVDRDTAPTSQPAATTPSAPPQSDSPNPPVSDPPEVVDDPEPLPYDPANAQHVIYLDAGHGWYDNGCSILDRTDIYEKDITLAITKHIRASLEEMGYTVVMARENDETCVEELVDGIYKSSRRIAYANNIGADYYVSIHVDSFADNPDVSGTRIYYRDRYDANGKLYPSRELSEQIANSLVETLHIDQPLLKDDRTYNVIILNRMPSVLVEVGFGSNPTDAANMVNPTWQASFARAVALGINAQVNADNGTSVEG